LRIEDLFFISFPQVLTFIVSMMAFFSSGWHLRRERSVPAAAFAGWWWVIGDCLLVIVRFRYGAGDLMRVLYLCRLNKKMWTREKKQ